MSWKLTPSSALSEFQNAGRCATARLKFATVPLIADARSASKSARTITHVAKYRRSDKRRDTREPLAQLYPGDTLQLRSIAPPSAVPSGVTDSARNCQREITRLKRFYRLRKHTQDEKTPELFIFRNDNARDEL